MLGTEIPIRPARGQMLVTEPAPRIIRRVVSGGEPAARQTRRGNVLIGSMVEDVGYDKGVTTGVLGRFARGILPFFPTLRGLQVIRTWAGLRPASPDHSPIIQMLEEPHGACVATGHSKRGMIQAGGTAQLVTEMILGKPPFLPLAPFSLDRFAEQRESNPAGR